MIDEDLIKYVNRSSYRVKTLKTLAERPKMPKDIAVDTNILQNHISNVLTLLSKLELIVCINPEVKKGRIYRLTEDGQEMLKYLK